MTILHRPPAKGNLGPFDVRTEVAAGQPKPPTLADFLADPRLSDRAKRLAEYLEGCCRAEGRWIVWPKVSTMASALGWDKTSYGGRKRVERGLRELAEAGYLVRLNLRELVEWFDSEGASMGLTWDPRLPRGIRQSLKVCLLVGRITGASGRLPILTRCDTSVASKLSLKARERDAGVACRTTQVSHGVATEVSHPTLNVRSLNERSEETTTDSSRTHAREGDGEAVRSSSSRSRKGGGGEEETTAGRRADPIVAVSRAHLAPERTPAEPPAFVPLKALAPASVPMALAPPRTPPGDSLAPALDRVMERAQAATPPVEPPADREPPPAPKVESPPVERPGQNHRRRLHDWIKGYDPDPGFRSDTILLVQEMVDMIANTHPVEGTTMDPHEQIRLALENAAEVEKNGDLDQSIGVYARGIIKRRIGREGFSPLRDPAAAIRAPQPDLVAEARAERRRVEAEAAAREESQTRARMARWDALPAGEREAIEARVKAENPGLARWPNMLLPLYLAAMGDGREEGASEQLTSSERPPVSPDPLPIASAGLESPEIAEVAPPSKPAAAFAEPAPPPARLRIRPAVAVPPRSQPEAQGLNSMQRAFLDGLTADQRARFDGWSPERRAAAVEQARLGQGVQILRELSTWNPAPPPAAPPVPVPARAGVLGRLKDFMRTLKPTGGAP
jgi:hypothetical protein